jgi:hypothetical protein
MKRLSLRFDRVSLMDRRRVAALPYMRAVAEVWGWKIPVFGDIYLFFINLRKELPRPAFIIDLLQDLEL